MVKARVDGIYDIDVQGYSKMSFLSFHPGPWFSGKRVTPEVCFWTLPEGSWNFIRTALLTLYKLILFRVNVIWWKIRGCGENIL